MKNVILAASAVTLLASLATAQVATSAAAFQAAIANDPGQFLNDCNSGGTGGTGGSPAMTHVFSAPAGLYDSTSSGGFIGTNTSTDAFTVTFTTGNVYAVGGEWFFSSASDSFVPGRLVTLTYSDGFVDTFTPGSFNDFRGYVSAVPLTSVVMTGGGNGAWAGTGSLITSSVPTPGAAAMLGLGGLAGFRRRRA